MGETPATSAASLTAADRIRLLEALAGPHGLPPTPAQPADLLVVFGCDDATLARDAVSLFNQQAVHCVVFSGGTGKDSGPLADLGIAEGDFLASVAIAAGLPARNVLVERVARNGAQNAVLSLRLARNSGVLPESGTVAGLAPAPRCRRLYEELRYQAQLFDSRIEVVAGLPSGRSAVNLEDRATVAEMLSELQGLHTMHAVQPQRIARLPEYQAGGRYSDLLRAGLHAEAAPGCD